MTPPTCLTIGGFIPVLYRLSDPPQQRRVLQNGVGHGPLDLRPECFPRACVSARRAPCDRETFRCHAIVLGRRIGLSRLRMIRDTIRRCLARVSAAKVQYLVPTHCACATR